jgi:hypothetical protein
MINQASPLSLEAMCAMPLSGYVKHTLWCIIIGIVSPVNLEKINSKRVVSIRLNQGKEDG